MPKVEHEGQLPRRLRELRQEVGMTLDDMVPLVGVAAKGVISNWEALNERCRTPGLPTLLVIQRLYGVSLDYLVGNPSAERDSPEVKVGKRVLHKHLNTITVPRTATPSQRARLALKTALDLVPEAFFLERAALSLEVSVPQVRALLKETEWPTRVIDKLAAFLGIAEEWFYPPVAEIIKDA